MRPVVAAAALGLAACPAAARADVAVHPDSGLGEPEIAVNPLAPANIVVGENDTGVSFSRDGGATWKQVPLPNPGDNVLAVAPDGTFLYSTLDGDVRASRDGGETWATVGNWVGRVAAQAHAAQPTGAGAFPGREVGCNAPGDEGPVEPDPAQGPGPQVIGCDRPWLVADPQTGTLYVSFAAHDEHGGGAWELGTFGCRGTVLTNPAFECGRQYVAASHDQGRTWSAFRPFDDARHPAAVTGGFSSGPVAAHGVLATAYASSAGRVVFAASTDDGVSWKRRPVPTSIGKVPAVATEASTLFQPYTAADPSRPGRYAVMVFDDRQRELLVFVTDDAGATWQGPARLGDPGGAQRWVPWIAYGPTGALGAVWKTSSADETFATWAAIAPRGDTGFATPVRLSAAPSPGPPTQLAGDDASDVALDERALHAVWGDRRTGKLGIRYGRADLPAAGACVSRRGFRVRLAGASLRGRHVRSVTVTLDGRPLRVLRGRRITAFVSLRGLPRGHSTLRITVRFADGRVLRGTRTYLTCTSRRGGRRVIPL